MPDFLTRTDRPVTEVSGVGGMLKFGRPDYAVIPSDAQVGLPGFADVILDITSWRIRHTLNLVDVTHSGSYGGQKFAMVGRHWEAQIALAWNAQPRSDAANSTDDWSGFLENLLVGKQNTGFNVAVIFFLGDPLSYVTRADGGSEVIRPSPKLAAPLALASNIETINDAGGKDVIRQTAALTGNSKLQGWVGKENALSSRIF